MGSQLTAGCSVLGCSQQTFVGCMDGWMDGEELDAKTLRTGPTIEVAKGHTWPSVSLLILSPEECCASRSGFPLPPVHRVSPSPGVRLYRKKETGYRRMDGWGQWWLPFFRDIPDWFSLYSLYTEPLKSVRQQNPSGSSGFEESMVVLVFSGRQ